MVKNTKPKNTPKNSPIKLVWCIWNAKYENKAIRNKLIELIPIEDIKCELVIRNAK